MANLSMSPLFLDHEEEEEFLSFSDDVTHPVIPPPQPLNEGHEADVDELVAKLSDHVIASENSSSVSFNVVPLSPTLTDAVVGECVANLSDDVTSLDASSSVSCPVTPPSQPLTEALVVVNLDNGDDDDPILDVADDYRGGGGSSRRSTVFLDGGVSGYSVEIKIGDYINRHVDDEDQCDDADDDYYDDDLDDDLIPRSVRKTVKGDRMRKTGKRAFTKPGCVYGKYGLSI